MVDLQSSCSGSDPLRTEDTPELRQDLSDAAAFLLPLAHAHVSAGSWSIEVAAWLTMIRDSLAQREAGSSH